MLRYVSPENVGGPSSREMQGSQGLHFSVSDYHAAFDSGEITPIAVAKALLALILGDQKHRVDFLKSLNIKSLPRPRYQQSVTKKERPDSIH